VVGARATSTVAEAEKQVLDDEEVVRHSPHMTRESVVLEPVLVSPSYLGTLVRARKCKGNLASRTLWPKARGPLWLGDQLRSRSLSLSWHRPCTRSSWGRERSSRWLSMLPARRRASMVFRASQSAPSRLLTADVVAPPPSPRSQC
jgi:hypothetical protein